MSDALVIMKKSAAFIIMHYLIKIKENKKKFKHYLMTHLYQNRNQYGELLIPSMKVLNILIILFICM